jgi:hypothetical protein
MDAAGGAVFSLPYLKRTGATQCVRSLAERRAIFGISVNIAEKDGQVVAYESWTNDERTTADLAEGVAEWIELRAENAPSLEATITISQKPR